ncbi:OB-fold domain-containing protein [Albimonas sp. CAU 1670]|uniref:OB-fold domain-containing protein n=1 Tax=Albimonas sp. CAU 1670 TaxID=3032599 RepID=UPI0023DBC665|nr:OB-fold domain-containing protein [Albimonas sp. CAU 1670]MDF2235705.1 OB-fold domain-containing protein [Albimonas sp. CAU 1670]
MDFGITAVGAYAPRLRLSRAAIAAAHRWMAPALASSAKGERAFCSWDEDAITMAVEAARDCVPPEGRAAVSSLILASTTLPYADMSNASVVAGALDLRESARTAEATGSQRAATSALAQAIKARAEGALLVATERPTARPASIQEMQQGAGAAALQLGTGDLIAKVLGVASVNAAFADHVRAAGATADYAWEERWIRDEGYAKIIPRAISAALIEAGIAAGELGRFVMPSPIRGAAASVARTVGFRGEVADDLAAGCGLTGAAHPFLMLAKVLETAEAGEKILLVGFGQGADAIVLEATGRRPAGRGVTGALADRVPTEDYLRMLSFYGRIELEWGMRAEAADKAALTAAWREAEQLSAFKAGRCPDCGTIQFPQLAYCVTPGCGAHAERFEQVSLADAPAKVLTYTADWLSYHPAPPLVVGFVQFENGARLLMETVDADPAAVDVGLPLRMVFRLKKIDARSGFRRYFWKATPDIAAATG